MTNLFSPAGEVADARKAARRNNGIELHILSFFLLLQ
jgi:hypothetical protein